MIDRLLDLAAVAAADVPDSARTMARLSLFDWLVCGLAGADEPVAGIVRDYARSEGGHPVAAVFGGGPVPARAAALVNGTISHALDCDGLMGAQGFVPTHSDAPTLAGIRDLPPPQTFVFGAVKYKLHACCHGTHAMIEALAVIKHSHNLTIERVAAINLRTSPRWLSVCDIKAPRTGLAIKFSYNWLAGMVLSGMSTSRDDSYGDGLAQDGALAAFAARVTVSGADEVGDMQAVGEVVLSDGNRLDFAHDLAARLPVAMLERSLMAKAKGLLGAARADRLWSAVAGLVGVSARELGRMVAAS